MKHNTFIKAIRLYLLLTPIVLLSCNSEVAKQNSEGLMGNVKSLKDSTTKYGIRFGELTETSWSIPYEYKYDNLGNKIEYVSSKTKGLYEYNNDVVVRETYYDGDIIKSVTEYSYDSTGNVIKKQVSKEGNIIKDVTEYSYDNTGNMIKKEQVSKGGYGYNKDLIWVWFYEYNEKGLLAKEFAVRNGEIMKVYVYEYDGNNNNIAKRTYNKDSDLLATYKYDKYGNEIECIDISMPNYKSSRLSSYDKWSNPVKITYIKEDGKEEITIYEYIYDKHNNWIKRNRFEIKSDNKTLHSITDREITYY